MSSRLASSLRLWSHRFSWLAVVVLAGCEGSDRGARDATMRGERPSALWHAVVDSSAVWRVDDASPCSDCIAFSKLVVLRDSMGLEYVEGARAGAQDSAGRYWIGQRGHVRIYAQDGSYLTTLGRPGKGPGEFSIPLPIHADASGNVHIIDSGNGRESVYAPNLARLSETRLPFRSAFSIAPLHDGTAYLANSWLQSEQSAGLMLHIIRQDSVIRSFGPPTSSGALTPFLSERIVAADEEGRAFSAERFRFSISVFSPEGRALVGIEGPELNASLPTGPVLNLSTNPLPSEILGVQLLRGHLLLVLSRRVRPHWRLLMVERLLSNGIRSMAAKPGTQVTAESLFTARLEVIDLRSRRIVARQDRAEVFSGFIGGDLLVHNTEDAEGMPTIAVWRLSLALP